MRVFSAKKTAYSSFRFLVGDKPGANKKARATLPQVAPIIITPKDLALADINSTGLPEISSDYMAECL